MRRRDFWSKYCGMWSGRQNVTQQQEENLRGALEKKITGLFVNFSHIYIYHLKFI